MVRQERSDMKTENLTLKDGYLESGMTNSFFESLKPFKGE